MKADSVGDKIGKNKTTPSLQFVARRGGRRQRRGGLVVGSGTRMEPSSSQVVFLSSGSYKKLTVVSSSREKDWKFQGQRLSLFIPFRVFFSFYHKCTF